MQLFNNPAFKWFELIFIFIGLPLLYYFDMIPFHKAIPLLSFFLLFLIIILKDESFDRTKLGLNHFRNWKPIFLRFFIFAILTTTVVYLIIPKFLFILPSQRTYVWLIIIFSYPLWSAFPQEFIYRTWFFHRYRNLFRDERLFLISNAFLFSFSHIIFRNWIAIILTFAGGLMFALTYKKSNSTMTVFVEHALYGIFIFTVGIGQYFYLPMATGS